MRFKVRALSVVAALLGSAAVVAVQSPAEAAITTTSITNPVNGTQWTVTSSNPGTVTVSGTAPGASDGDLVDIRCYEVGSLAYQSGPTSVAVQGGSFSVQMPKNDPYGRCRLKAVPHGLADGADLTPYTGPVITVEFNKPTQYASGPNAGKVYGFSIAFQGVHAMADFSSATEAGFWATRFTSAAGESSNYLWTGGAALGGDSEGSKGRILVDGRPVYGPASAQQLFPNNLGAPALTYSSSRNGITGVTTIREIDPLVRCPIGAPFPPTAGTCPQFTSAGVRLERTSVSTDGGRQVHITDVWRSTDGKAHTISPHYYQEVDGFDYVADSATPVSIKLPAVAGGYHTFAGDATYPGTASVANSLFVRASDTAVDGDTLLPRGALTFDFPVSAVHRTAFDRLVMQGSAFTLLAGGTRVTRQTFAMGTSESEIAAKAATNRAQLNPYRVDGMIKRKAARAYVGNGIYNSTAAGQTVLSRIKRSKTAVFYVLVQNDGNQPSTMRVTGTGARPGYAVQYYTGASGGQRITGSVVRGQYLVANLAPGTSRLIRLVVKVKAGTPIGRTGSWLIRATSTKNPARTDVVRAKVKVRS